MLGFLLCFFSFIKGKKIPFNVFLSQQVLIGIIAKLVIAKITDIPSYSKTMLTSKVTSQGQPVALFSKKKRYFQCIKSHFEAIRL